jgi:hypothetical protein
MTYANCGRSWQANTNKPWVQEMLTATVSRFGSPLAEIEPGGLARQNGRDHKVDSRYVCRSPAALAHLSNRI